MTDTPTDLRPSLTTYLAQRVAAFQDGFRHNLAVLGPVGSGKSSLLQHALRTAHLTLPTMVCSLQQESLQGFLRRLITAILRTAVEAPAEASIETLLQQAQSRIPLTAAAIQRSAVLNSPAHLHADAFVQILDLIPLLHQEVRQPCVLVLDEFLFLEDLGLSHTFHEVGKRVMTWPFVLFLMTSSSSVRARTILRERLHLLFGQFELITLGAPDTSVALSWMQQELGCPVRSSELLRFMLHWIGASPWYLSVLVKRLNELARLKRIRQVSEATLMEAAWDVLGSPDGALYHWCTTSLERLAHQRHGLIARDALLAIAKGARTTSAIAQHGGKRSGLSCALELLVQQDLVQRKGTCWVIPDQLLTCWLAAVWDIRARGMSLSSGAAREHFERTLADIWAKWLQVTTQPLAQRVHHLLSLFRNETVSLDHKTGRLPTFQELRVQPSPDRGETYLVADGQERRWCCLIHERRLEESAIAAFEKFCRMQSPKPARKVVVAREGLDGNATLCAKAANMWVWEPDDVNLLFLLYGQPPLDR